MPIAGDDVFSAVRLFYERLDGVRDLLTDGNITSARLVVNAERIVVAEARRTFTYLSLFGYHVGGARGRRGCCGALGRCSGAGQRHGALSPRDGARLRAEEIGRGVALFRRDRALLRGRGRHG